MLNIKEHLPAMNADRGNRDGRVLIIEDDPQVRDVMEQTFDDAGYQVDAADSVEGGLRLIQSGEFDIIVADGRLEDGTGLEVADAVWDRDIPTLIVTGYAFDLLREKRDLASYNVLQKPLRPAQLIAAAEALLRLRHR